MQCNKFIKKFQLKWSYAFWISSLHRITGCLSLSLESKLSLAINIASMICMFLMKVIYCLSISLCITFSVFRSIVLQLSCTLLLLDLLVWSHLVPQPHFLWYQGRKSSIYTLLKYPLLMEVLNYCYHFFFDDFPTLATESHGETIWARGLVPGNMLLCLLWFPVLQKGPSISYCHSHQS